ncbi:hypothetical protein D3C75_190750 [compost metagenome]
MSYTLCYKLIPMSSGIVGHGFKEPSDGFLVPRRDAPVLPNKQIFHFGKRLVRQRCRNSIHYVTHVKTKLARGHAQVRRRRITGTRFIIALGSFRDTKFIGELILSKPCLGAQLSEPSANLFGESQIISTRIFTMAVFCHILRSSSHENARNCTMPNTSITEQARKQAREALEKRGQSAKDFAKLHNLNPSTVYAVLSGQSLCRRGEAHRAAVLLGIKDGVIEQ